MTPLSDSYLNIFHEDKIRKKIEYLKENVFLDFMAYSLKETDL